MKQKIFAFAVAGTAGVLIATLVPRMPAQDPQDRSPQDHWVLGPWTRASEVPVIRPEPKSTFVDPVSNQPVHWEALHTFNPAAIIKDGKVVVLYRAEDDSGEMAIGGHTSRLGMAVSEDGVHFKRMPEPVFFPAKDGQTEREASGGVEDPRLVEAPDGSYVLTYTQWSRNTHVFTIGVATSPDLQNWTKFGPAFGSDGKYAHLKYKSAGIVTRLQNGRPIAAKIDGKYWMYWGEGEIHLATSSDLIHWHPLEDKDGALQVLLRKRPGKSDSGFPETGPPALATPRGIVLLYNAKNAANDTADSSVGAGAYTVQEALFSATDPSQLIARTDTPVLQPALAWEKSGQYKAGTTFGEGLVLFHGQWLLYYGSADSFVGVAKAPQNIP
ncbi:MAG TPA: glycoside hydrolase family 130 protein [Acidobacteriaceae bacterium]